mmetsp:Transcript_1690/g.4356  ORF Transcript_1690/g.4356 Transcript_1690/m.4356 type:complete len:231 (-) Transcript_1690:1356-2048(-)
MFFIRTGTVTTQTSFSAVKESHLFTINLWSFSILLVSSLARLFDMCVVWSLSKAKERECSRPVFFATGTMYQIQAGKITAATMIAAIVFATTGLSLKASTSSTIASMAASVARSQHRPTSSPKPSMIFRTAATHRLMRSFLASSSSIFLRASSLEASPTREPCCWATKAVFSLVSSSSPSSSRSPPCICPSLSANWSSRKMRIHDSPVRIIAFKMPIIDGKPIRESAKKI